MAEVLKRVRPLSLEMIRSLARWMRKTELIDAALCGAAEEMARGLIDADLGGGVVKKRIGMAGRGKSGSARTLVASEKGSNWFFVYGFEKNDKGNISEDELEALQTLAKDLLVRTGQQIDLSEIRAMPLPPLEAIHAIGREAMHSQSLTEIDEMVERLTTNREREIAGSLHFPARCVPAVTRCTVSLQYPDNFSVSVTKREAIASV